MNMNNVKKIYFIGIGGSSMSGLASIMLSRGYEIFGSDMQTSDATETLINQGVKVFFGHDRQHIIDIKPDIVIITEAIMQTNPELIAVKKFNIPLYYRKNLLSYILDDYKCTIGVAGTHGKTTTTSMIESILSAADKDPSALIGGKSTRLNASYKVGNNQDFCVFESCEYKDQFLSFHSDISIILNIAEDHMEYFKTADNLIASFRKYLDNTRENGTVIANAECIYSQNMLKNYSGKVITFGLEKGDITAKNVVLTNGLPIFDVYINNSFYAKIELSVPGLHNVKNALAAVCAVHILNLEKNDIINGLKNFSGVVRRFEYHCKINGAIIADDYAHHPDAYAVTFETARLLGFKRIIAIHQPHTFSRTKMMMKEFTDILKTVDLVLIPPIYAARETNDDYQIFSEDIVKVLPNAELMRDFDHIAERVKELAQPGDLFITLGCGDIYKAAKLINLKYGEKLN